MADANSVLSRLLASLSVSDPTWDTSVGSATYKILESVANELANTANNSTLLSYGLDVTTKFGTELDAFVNIFGITRQLGTRAIGTATFSVGSGNVATQNYDIPNNTQIYTISSVGANGISFSTTSPATISSGSQSVVVPIASALPGTFNNVSVGTITGLATPLLGVSTVINTTPAVYGTDPETDSQLQQRFLNTAFSNFSGTYSKFQSLAQQNPAITQTNVIGTQQFYTESLQIGTVVSGNSTFNVGLQTLAQLTVASGATTASGNLGALEPNVTVYATSTSPVGIYPLASGIIFDGVNYNLNGTATASGFLNIAYVYSGSSPVTLSGGTAASALNTTVTNLLNSASLNYNNTINVTVTGTISGSNTVVSGLTVTFSQGTPWNLVITSGSTVSSINTIVSQIPDSKFCYPAGNEVVGLNFGSVNQSFYTRNVDYNYIQASGTPPVHLQITFIPTQNNAPNTFTGSTIQLMSEYIPMSSRVTITGNGTQIANPNYVDVFINSTNVLSTFEQVVFINTNVITASGTGGAFDASQFKLANGNTPPTGDYVVDFSQGPVASFPNQVISGNAPSYLSLGAYNYPIALTVSGFSTLTVNGTAGNNYVTTTTSVSGLTVGLVASGTAATIASGIGTGNYITSITPGNPNTIYLATNLVGNVNGSIGWQPVAYPIYDNTNNAGSIQDLTAVALKAIDPTGSYGTSYFTNINYQTGILAHSFYADVVTVDNLSQQSRVIGSNVLARQAQFLPLVLNFSIVYSPGATPSNVNLAVQSAINGYLSSVPFGRSVSIAGLLSSVYRTNGLQSIRLTNSNDNPTYYGIQVVNIDGSPNGTPYLKDILLRANQVPLLYAINFNVFGINNF